VAANERALDRLRALGVAVHAAFMLMPESTPRTSTACAPMSALATGAVQLHRVHASPGTPDYRALDGRFWSTLRTTSTTACTR